MIRKGFVVLLLLALAACSRLQGEMVEGLYLDGLPQFVTTDGRVYSVGDRLPAHASLLGLSGQCLRLDVSFLDPPPDYWGYENWIVHRVLSARPADQCRFETRTYRGLYVIPIEGAHFFTDPESTSDWARSWALVPMSGSNLSEDLPQQYREIYQRRRMCIEIEAIASQPGHFNHLGISDRQLTVRRVVRIWQTPELPAEISLLYRREGGRPPIVIPPEIEACLRD